VEYQGGDDESHYWCHYCDAELKDIGYQFTKEDFKHELNCPVLIAQDVLTRIKVNNELGISYSKNLGYTK
jgi:hypothetical protein